jgi:hypothetical protein
MADSEKPVPPLKSWQSIAEYLGVSVRTAQKWEAERGLPVTRHNGGRGTVTASAEELDRWRDATSEKLSLWDNPRLMQILAGVTVGLLAVQLCAGVIYLIVHSMPGPPAKLSLESDSLIASDSDGQILWRQRLETPPRVEEDQEESYTGARGSFADIDGDGRIETLYAHTPASVEERNAVLMCFSSKGQVRWRFRPGRLVHTSTTKFEPHYVISFFGLLPAPERRTKYILVVSNHASGYPSQVALLDFNGRLLGEYWHSGPLSAVEIGDIDRDGAVEVFLGGASSPRQAATLVVLDPLRLRGASVENGFPEYQLQELGAGAEKARLVFPRTGLSRALESRSFVSRVWPYEGTLRVETTERSVGFPGAARPAVIYALDSQLQVAAVEATDEYWVQHRQLESARQVSPSLRSNDIRTLATGVEELLNCWKGKGAEPCQRAAPRL